MKTPPPPSQHQHGHHTHLVTVTLLSVTIALLVLGVLFMIYLLVKKNLTETDTFDIHETSVVCSDASKNLYCLCKKGQESQKMCFEEKSKNEVTVTVPLLKFSKTFSMDSLSTDEDHGDTFHLLNMEYSAFRHPWVEGALCFRKTSDPKKPQRLCYVVDDHKAFISGPTKIILETL